MGKLFGHGYTVHRERRKYATNNEMHFRFMANQMEHDFINNGPSVLEPTSNFVDFRSRRKIVISHSTQFE